VREHYPIIGRPATLISAATLATTAGLAASRLALAAAACAVAGLAAVAVVSTVSHHRALARITTLHADLRRALTDPVTGLPVRTVAEAHLHATTGTNLTVAVVDVDDMHSVNNTHGHDFGDAYLAHIAHALRRATAPGDLVARLGGDEFLVITTDPPARLAAALDRQLTKPVRIGDRQILLAASAGICPIDGGSARTAVGRADRAMLRAKRERAITAVHDPTRDSDPPPPGTRPTQRDRDRTTRR
jgi:diguanylate cyclase (GGDEF)-like protein